MGKESWDEFRTRLRKKKLQQKDNRSSRALRKQLKKEGSLHKYESSEQTTSAEKRELEQEIVKKGRKQDVEEWGKRYGKDVKVSHIVTAIDPTTRKKTEIPVAKTRWGTYLYRTSSGKVIETREGAEGKIARGYFGVKVKGKSISVGSVRIKDYRKYKSAQEYTALKTAIKKGKKSVWITPKEKGKEAKMIISSSHSAPAGMRKSVAEKRGFRKLKPEEVSFEKGEIIGSYEPVIPTKFESVMVTQAKLQTGEYIGYAVPKGKLSRTGTLTGLLTKEGTEIIIQEKSERHIPEAVKIPPKYFKLKGLEKGARRTELVVETPTMKKAEEFYRLEKKKRLRAEEVYEKLPQHLKTGLGIYAGGLKGWQWLISPSKRKEIEIESIKDVMSTPKEEITKKALMRGIDSPPFTVASGFTLGAGFKGVTSLPAVAKVLGTRAGKIGLGAMGGVYAGGKTYEFSVTPEELRPALAVKTVGELGSLYFGAGGIESVVKKLKFKLYTEKKIIKIPSSRTKYSKGTFIKKEKFPKTKIEKFPEKELKISKDFRSKYIEETIKKTPSYRTKYTPKKIFKKEKNFPEEFLKRGEWNKKTFEEHMQRRIINIKKSGQIEDWKYSDFVAYKHKNYYITKADVKIPTSEGIITGKIKMISKVPKNLLKKPSRYETILEFPKQRFARGHIEMEGKIFRFRGKTQHWMEQELSRITKTHLKGYKLKHPEETIIKRYLGLSKLEEIAPTRYDILKGRNIIIYNSKTTKFDTLTMLQKGHPKAPVKLIGHEKTPTSNYLYKGIIKELKHPPHIGSLSAVGKHIGSIQKITIKPSVISTKPSVITIKPTMKIPKITIKPSSTMRTKTPSKISGKPLQTIQQTEAQLYRTGVFPNPRRTPRLLRKQRVTRISRLIDTRTTPQRISRIPKVKLKKRMGVGFRLNPLLINMLGQGLEKEEGKKRAVIKTRIITRTDIRKFAKQTKYMTPLEMLGLIVPAKIGTKIMPTGITKPVYPVEPIKPEPTIFVPPKTPKIPRPIIRTPPPFKLGDRKQRLFFGKGESPLYRIEWIKRKFAKLSEI